jgi:hypothetical protein
MQRDREREREREQEDQVASSQVDPPPRWSKAVRSRKQEKGKKQEARSKKQEARSSK